jgi:RNA polymerase sigma-70 factor (ECF subfamily)
LSDGAGKTRLADWYRDWRLPLRRFLSRRNKASGADIDDISQEVFLRLLRYERTELVNQPQAYLFKIASNVSAEWRMRATRDLTHDPAWLAELVGSVSPPSELDTENAIARLETAVCNLPPRAREILRLRFTDGLSYAQVAAKMGVSLKIVSRDIERAYATIRLAMMRSLQAGDPAADMEQRQEP